jgi:hypothetical protein
VPNFTSLNVCKILSIANNTAAGGRPWGGSWARQRREFRNGVEGGVKKRALTRRPAESAGGALRPPSSPLNELGPAPHPAFFTACAVEPPAAGVLPRTSQVRFIWPGSECSPENSDGEIESFLPAPCCRYPLALTPATRNFANVFLPLVPEWVLFARDHECGRQPLQVLSPQRGSGRVDCVLSLLEVEVPEEPEWEVYLVPTA